MKQDLEFSRYQLTRDFREDVISIRTRIMKKEQLIKLAKNLWQQSMLIKSYYILWRQYGQNQEKHPDAIKCSPFYYNITYYALFNAMMMGLSRLYDTKDTLSIGYLLNICNNNKKLFPYYEDVWKVSVDGKEYVKGIHFRHTISQKEEWFFGEYIKQERKWREILNKCFECDMDQPFSKEVIPEELIELYTKTFNALKKKRDRLREQRNKIFAHNDQQVNFNTKEISAKNRLSVSDIETLIDFTFDVERFVVGCLKNEFLPDKFVNSDDWEYTLQLVDKSLNLQNQHKSH